MPEAIGASNPLGGVVQNFGSLYTDSVGRQESLNCLWRYRNGVTLLGEVFRLNQQLPGKTNEAGN
jgi:hypothetical protein